MSQLVRSGWEYRVRWRRADSRESTRIYQSHSAAWKKARAVLAVEAVKEGTTFANMADLIEPPTIERRPVGAWERRADQLRAAQHHLEHVAHAVEDALIENEAGHV